MIESMRSERPTSAGAPSNDAIEQMKAVLGQPAGTTSDAELVDRIRVLEELKAAAAAAQAVASAQLDASTRAAHEAAGLPASVQGKGVAAQVALARRESPVRGGRHLGLAKALVHEMPHTLRALSAGWLSEWRATLLVRETACLTREDRATIDRTLVADPARLDGLGDRALVAEIKKLAYRLDPHSVVRRARRAEAERRVTCRPAPDTMAYLTALLPVTQAVAVMATLSKAADAARSAGDPRTRGQVTADTLVERLTGQSAAPAVPIEVQVVMTDRALLQGDDEPARIPGYGVVPAGMARHWLRRHDSPTSGSDHGVWLRRLFTHPSTGQLIGLESRARLFPAGLRRFLIARDQTCRTPWCDAPIRHADHVHPHEAGGPTSAANGAGLCEQCNHTKQAPGWRVRPGPRHAAHHRHSLHITTPTDHRYHSTAPPIASDGLHDPRSRPGTTEAHFRDLVLGA